MTARLTVSDVASQIGAIADRLEENRDALCRLDGVIGDGDHGVAMAEGFRAAAKAAIALDPAASTLADVFNATAKAFLNAVGASSGPLYATAFLRAGKIAGPRAEMPIEESPRLIIAIAEGVKTRGQASIGDKTMLDAWGKAAEVAQEGLDEGESIAPLLERIRRAAEDGAEATKTMTATKGRAARLGARSLGHIDPGAASAVLMIDTLVANWLRRLAS